jgi:hypothetical protein
MVARISIEVMHKSAHSGPARLPLALHVSQPSATVVVGEPSRSHSIKLVEPEQFRAPVFQPNV